MSNALSLTAAAIVACLLLFIYPTGKSYEQQDQLAYSIAYKSVTNFTDSVRSKGYITPAMYREFESELDATGNLYSIELQHDEKRYHPLYSDPADDATFQNDFDVYYEARYTADIMDVLFPEDGSSVTEEDRKYLLKQYDYFTVHVVNTNRTKATLVREFLNMGFSGNADRINIPYGGMVLNEDY
ncbi:hypothetical protein [Paenibacillus harenae]|uniref:Uncharacterized protein n=1 Tax=Paenibacillus harenae TaxID=306543 RepID=A0ABT9TUA9_PAEHA|nr:hypothetical protein [Paenibacillus harenae]MDQ0110652.1 hypothetical protein [Paenibacillus harenae]